jgi:electron transfer flavoprotein alpha subunit
MEDHVLDEVHRRAARAAPARGARRGHQSGSSRDGRRSRRAGHVELLGRAPARRGAGSAVEALVVWRRRSCGRRARRRGADRVLVADDPRCGRTRPRRTLRSWPTRSARGAPATRALGSTAIGRDLAPRVAARLGLGLTGDAIGLELDPDGRTRQLKPAFGGTIVAPILSRTRPEMATVRPGMLHAARPDPGRAVLVETLVVAAPRRGCVSSARRPCPTRAPRSTPRASSSASARGSARTASRRSRRSRPAGRGARRDA